MKTKNRKESLKQPKTDDPVEVQGNIAAKANTLMDVASEKPELDGNRGERFQLSFDTLADGSPDMSAIREKTKERARQFLNDPKMREAFGATPSNVANGSAVNLFPIAPGEKYPAMIGSLYNILGTMEILVAQRFGKIPAPIAHRVFTYTEQEKEALAGPTVKVLNKWAPEWLIKYQDEIALANLLISVTVSKVNAAIALNRIQSQAQNAPEPKKEGDGPTSQPN